MKRDKLTFLIAELILIVLAAFFIHKIFQEDVAQKRVAVILQNSGDTRWEGVINGLKQSAKTNNLHLFIFRCFIQLADCLFYLCITGLQQCLNLCKAFICSIYHI